MIVFWRLVLAYYICAVLFYNKHFFAWRNKHPHAASWGQGLVFMAIAMGLCWPYLQMKWPLAEVLPIPGYVSVILATLFYMVANRLFVCRTGQQHGYTWTFLAHDFLVILFLFLCSPLHMLAQTGLFMAEVWTLCIVGVLVVTKMFSVFIYMVELDIYERESLTIDESFVTMLMRLIFFLILLLPGWRWLVWFGIWVWACLVARKNRLMDLSPFALWFSILGSSAVGFLVRCAWYQLL